MKALTVDDDVGTVKMLERQLAWAGFEAEGVSTGHMAWALFESALREGKPFHVVLVDLNLPDMQGIELIRRIHQNRAETYVIVCTGVTDFMVARDCARAGARGWLGKPFTLNALRIALAFVPEQRQGEIIG